MNKRRVVITGMGAITSIGNNLSETWSSVKRGDCGIDNITLYDASNHAVQIAAEVKNFNPEDHGIEKQEAKRMARFTQFLLAASKEAASDAKLPDSVIQGEKTGIIAGNGMGGYDVLENAFERHIQRGPSRIPPLAVPMLLANEAAGNVSIQMGITGHSWTLATACASGTDAIGASLDLVRSGRLDVCFAGGTESIITPFGIGGFSVLNALSRNNESPKTACRPFDKDRNGFIMGEGAAVLILEELEHALARGATIYGELAGYGASSDCYHITSPNPSGEGGAKAILRALKDAGVKPEEVDYYNAHGTSTQLNDATETKMIKNAFGNHAYKLKVSSTKSMTGHCVGAAGAVEAVISTKAMNENFFPPTINLENPDVEQGCDLDYVPKVGVAGTINCFVSVSLGFGGHNGAIVVKKFVQ
ncbi:MAG: beta-ketoacyl-ACP synthase II [Fibrobacter sp.]|jgi:3-oxoacyl-[acyl-carrier-protein] synthase II|nr:beta-ketoacyl-ACP synthase II [Fibrobacter sp.]